MHHALVSFLDCVPTVLAMLSDSARTRNSPPLWARPLPGTYDEQEEDEDGGLLASLTSLGRAGVGLLRAAVSPDKARGFLLPRSTPRSTLNRAINQQRRFATQQFERARIERIVFANSRAEAAAIGFCDDELYCELNRPFSARSIVMEHHPIPDALLPLQRWASNPDRTPY